MVKFSKKLQAVAVANYRLLSGISLSSKEMIDVINWTVTGYLPQRNLKHYRYA